MYTSATLGTALSIYIYMCIYIYYIYIYFFSGEVVVVGGETPLGQWVM